MQWRCRATSSTCSRLFRPPCRPARAGSPQQQRGQVTERPPLTICLFWTRVTCSACSSSLIVVWLWCPPLPLHPFFLSLSLSSACVDPFTSAEAGDDSMPNLNPFLSKLVVDATHLPVVSSDGVSFSSRTSAHEMFGGNASLWFFPKKLSSPCSFLC